MFGPRLCNSLPKDLRDFEGVKTEKLKFQHGKFIIPDQQTIPNYVPAVRSNRVLDQISHRRTRSLLGGVPEDSVGLGGVPESAMEWAFVLRNYSKYSK